MGVKGNKLLEKASTSSDVLKAHMIGYLEDILAASGGGGALPSFGPIVTVNVLDSTTEIVPANSDRKGLILINEDGEDFWLSFGTPAEVEKGIKIKKKAEFIIDSTLLTGQAINGICKNNKDTEVYYQELV